MSDKREDLENRLVEQAKQCIGQMLDAKAGRRDLSMSEMEDLVGIMETSFRESVMQTLVEESEVKDKEQCPECQGKLRYKGKKRKRIISVRGEIDIERAYYVCMNCGTGYFPPR